MCALREPLGDIGIVDIYALFFVIVITIIIFVICYHNLLFPAQANVKLSFGKKAGYDQ